MHPVVHSLSSVKKFGGKIEDYIKIHQWLDETKAWIPNFKHRAFRHHAEGIFEAERIFGTHFENSDGNIVYTRYIAELHVKEDCNGRIPNAKEWIEAMVLGVYPKWMLKVQENLVNDNGKIQSDSEDA